MKREEEEEGEEGEEGKEDVPCSLHELSQLLLIRVFYLKWQMNIDR